MTKSRRHKTSAGGITVCCFMEGQLVGERRPQLEYVRHLVDPTITGLTALFSSCRMEDSFSYGSTRFCGKKILLIRIN